MQAQTGVRPNFSCTVCHLQYEGLYDFKHHLESQEHELAYGIRLRNSMVGSYFCNCCHICVNTLLIWKSHIMGTKHMKIASAFSLAYSNFDFDKPAKISAVGVLDQNVEVPESLQRSNGKPSTLVRQIDFGTVVIGVTDIEYTGPGLYHCTLCDEPFNEGNKGQHLGSCRHRTNVFKRWDMALYEEAMSVKEVGKPEYSARCESIASEIFPVEQQVLSADKKMLYDRLMGTSSALDDQYYAEELAQGRPGPATGLVPASKPPSDYREPRHYDRASSHDRFNRPREDFSYSGNPHNSRYMEHQYPGRDPYGAPPEPRSRSAGPPPPPPSGRYGYREDGRGRGGRANRGHGRDGDYYNRSQGPHQDNYRVRKNQPPPPPKQVSIDTDIKCDLALESVRVLLQNLNVFVSETRNTSFTRVEILKAQILYEEVLKMAYPPTPKAEADDDFITVFHNGRMTLKRKEKPVKKDPVPEVKESKSRETSGKDQFKDSSVPGSSTSGDPPSPIRAPSHSDPDRHRSSNKEPKERHESHRSSSKESGERRSSHPGPVPPIPHQTPPRPMFDPWGRPIMMHPTDLHRGMPFFPPPDFYSGFPRPDEKPRESRERGGSPRRGSSPRQRTPPLAPSMVIPQPPLRKRTPPVVVDTLRDQKRPRSKTPERVVTLKEGSPVRSKASSRSPARRTSESRRSPGKRSPGRRSPRRSPKRSPSRRSPRKSPSRHSSSKRSPSRKSPRRRSPSRRSPVRKAFSRRRTPPRKSRSPPRRARSPKRKPEKQEDGDGTVFLDEGAYAELLESLG